ncbi:TetR/AcrR family transcriptional regulator [Streptomyces sp. MST-110588]|uniref:TetR/AcrR family transcriptional regulator n=1 Tax=Streptomyces sp. MST-110588 TaxID=2833628 RepID=UPI001F5CC588|nr:TetR/AcrR family transcriptional regulator [Streptomyces sp. MST-110588]UNO40566.1 TetR/AcrR family transcriptional regulator [Streptomyces sp. MST-110588]
MGSQTGAPVGDAAGAPVGDAAGAPVRRGLAEKRRAIMSAARTVFAREGFTRASVDAIAAEAGVSKRTIYNHFKDKEQLFRSMMVESSQALSAFHRELIERHIGRLTDPEPNLIAFAREFVVPQEEFKGHFALVRVINAEAGRLPREVLEAWQEAGPRPVRRVLADHLRQAADRGLLRIEAGEEELAAKHLALLTGAEVTQRTYQGAVEIPAEELAGMVAQGVRTFLRLYGSGKP